VSLLVERVVMEDLMYQVLELHQLGSAAVPLDQMGAVPAVVPVPMEPVVVAAVVAAGLVFLFPVNIMLPEEAVAVAVVPMKDLQMISPPAAEEVLLILIGQIVHQEHLV
jgi:hypothetical protein